MSIWFLRINLTLNIFSQLQCLNALNEINFLKSSQPAIVEIKLAIDHSNDSE